MCAGVLLCVRSACVLVSFSCDVCSVAVRCVCALVAIVCVGLSCERVPFYYDSHVIIARCCDVAFLFQRMPVQPSCAYLHGYSYMF